MSIDTDTTAFRLLAPESIRIDRVGGVPRLTVDGDRSRQGISVSRAFPISDPDHYIGLLDSEGHDLGMIKEPSELDEESRTVVFEELDLRYFVPVIQQVQKVKEEFGSVYWTVDTSRGPREFVVRN